VQSDGRVVEVSVPIVATDPITKRAAVAGSAQMILRLLPRNGEKASVPSDRIRTTKHEIYIPVLKVTRRTAAGSEPSSASRRSGIPRAPTDPRKNAVEDAAAARPTSRAENRCVATTK
jgi:hypothetical protein